MASTALVQTRIDPKVKEQAAQTLETLGLSVSDAVRILLTRVAQDGMLPSGLIPDAALHDAWVRRSILQALESKDKDLSQAEVKALFAEKRKNKKLKSASV